MAVLKNKDNTELLVDCYCGCDSGIRFRINKEDYGFYCFMSYTNGNYYKEQDSLWTTICNKAKKIWAIIKNKDYYYSDITMTKDEFNEFVGYINNIAGYTNDNYHNDLAKVYDELNEMHELQVCFEDDRLEKEVEEMMYCNHDWKYTNEDETFATCSKCGVVKTENI